MAAPTETPSSEPAQDAMSGERALHRDALADLEDAVWAIAGKGDSALHHQLQQALTEMRDRRRTARAPATPGLLSRALHNPVAVITPFLALVGVGWQQLSAANELALEEARAKRQVRLSLIQAYVAAVDDDQRLSVLETSRVMPSVMGACSDSEARGTLGRVLGLQDRDCAERARAAEWVTKQSKLFSELQRSESEMRAEQAEAEAEQAEAPPPPPAPDASVDGGTPPVRPAPPTSEPRTPTAPARRPKAAAPPSKLDLELYQQRANRILMDEF